MKALNYNKVVLSHKQKAFNLSRRRSFSRRRIAAGMLASRKRKKEVLRSSAQHIPRIIDSRSESWPRQQRKQVRCCQGQTQERVANDAHSLFLLFVARCSNAVSSFASARAFRTVARIFPRELACAVENRSNKKVAHFYLFTATSMFRYARATSRQFGLFVFRVE